MRFNPFEKRTPVEKAKRGGKLTAEEWRQISFIDGYWPDYSEPSNQHGHASVGRALSLVPVFGAARLLADTISSFPLMLLQRDSQGIPKRQPTPSLFNSPSVHGTTVDWLHRAVVSMALQGDAIGLITRRDFYGFPTMMEWLNPEQVATQDGKLEGPGSFINPIWWWWGRPLDPRNILHIPWFSMPWRVRGLSPIGAYQLTMNVGIGAEEYAANWYSNGGVPPGTFQNTQKTFDDKDADQITSRLVARLQSRKPLVYGSDWVYNPIAIKPNEALFVECAIGSTMFSMADGTQRRADEIHAGDEVIAWDGDALVSSNVSSAVQMPSGPTVRVVTACGREVVTSPRHPYLASRRPRSAGKRYKGTLDSNSGWMHAADLQPGDYVRIGLDWQGQSDDQLDIETSWALGALIGDGHLPEKAGLGFTSVEPAIVDRLDEWLGRYGACLNRTAAMAAADYRINLGGPVGPCGSDLRRELRGFGVLGRNAAKKHVPQVVMRGGNKAWAAFLAGYLDTDGTVADASVTWSSVSPRLLRDCWHLLAMLGIKASIHQHTEAGRYRVLGKDCNRQASWNLTVCGTGNLSKLAGLLDLAHPAKARRLANFVGAKRNVGARSDPRWTRVVAVEDAGDQVTYGITVDDTHTHVTNGLITHNTMRLAATQIAVIYGIPPEKIGGSTGASLTYSTVEMNTIDYLTFSIQPWVTKLEAALSNCFPRGYYVRFDTAEMLRVDAETRAKVDQMSLGSNVAPGWMAVDEVRANRDLPPMRQAPADPAIVPQPPRPTDGGSNNTKDDNSDATNGLGGWNSEPNVKVGTKTNVVKPAVKNGRSATFGPVARVELLAKSPDWRDRMLNGSDPVAKKGN